LADNRTTVKVSADASGYTSELDRARKAAQAFQQSQDQAAERIRVAQQAIAEAATNGSNASARAINSFVSQMQRAASTAGQSQAQILQMKAAQLGVTDAVSGYITAIQQASEHTHEFNLNTTASRRELMVLAHEASQGSWSRFGGSLMVLGEQMDVMRLALSPVGLALTAAGGAAYLFVEKLREGAAQAEAFNKAITATGGYLGSSTEQMIAMSNGLETTHTSLTSVREAMAQVAATGTVTAENLQLATRAALAMSSDIGIGTDKAAESLAKIQEDVLKWVADYQQAHHTFNAAQIEEIDNFVRMGDTTGAYKAVLRDLVAAHEVAEESGKKATGFIAQGWHDILDVVGMYKNAIMNLGVPDGITKQVGDQLARVEAVQRSIDDQRRMGNTSAARAAMDQLAVEQKKLDVLRDQQAEQFKATRAREAAAKGGDQKIAVDSYLRSDKYASPGQKHTNELATESEAFGKATKDLDKNSKDYQDALKRHYDNVAKINEDYAKATRGHSNPNNAINSALADEKNRMSAIEATRRDALAQAKADFDTQRLQYQDYYAKVRDINVKAYDEEIAIQQKRVELASGKKELAARQSALGELQKLQAARLTAENDYTRAIAEQMKKRQEAVDKYRTQQTAAVQRVSSAYEAQDATRFMTSDQAAAFDAALRVRESFYQAVASLKEEYDSGRSDQQTFTEKLSIASDGYNQQLSLLRDHLAKEQAIRESFSAQMGLQLIQLSGDGKTTAQSLAEGFGSLWSVASSDLEKFITDGKFSFSSFTADILADMAKIALRMAEMSIFKSVATSFGFSTGGIAGYATGGHIVGAGTGTSDSIPAMLSNGEFVVNAASTKRYRSLLEAINSGQAQHFATGGAVGGGSVSTGGGGSPVSVTVNNNGGGGMTEQDAKDLHSVVMNWVDKRTVQNFRGQGGLAWQMKYNQI
jgi:lambda family phage tail tape measure protein